MLAAEAEDQPESDAEAVPTSSIDAHTDRLWAALAARGVGTRPQSVVSDVGDWICGSGVVRVSDDIV